jgi:hypothetical protein
MSKRPQIAAAMFDAVACMPRELCQLTAEFIELSHTWSAFQTVSVTANDDGSARISSPTERRLVCRKLVSAESLADGRLQWTVGDIDMSASGDGWIYAGVTRSKSNSSLTVDFASAAVRGDRLICISNKMNYVFMAYDGYLNYLADFDRKATTVVSIDFDAEPATGLITARISVDGRLLVETDILRATTRPDFAAVRPCVILAGRMQAVVR